MLFRQAARTTYESIRGTPDAKLRAIRHRSRQELDSNCQVMRGRLPIAATTLHHEKEITLGNNSLRLDRF